MEERRVFHPEGITLQPRSPAWQKKALLGAELPSCWGKNGVDGIAG